MPNRYGLGGRFAPHCDSSFIRSAYERSWWTVRVSIDCIIFENIISKVNMYLNTVPVEAEGATVFLSKSHNGIFINHNLWHILTYHGIFIAYLWHIMAYLWHIMAYLWHIMAYSWHIFVTIWHIYGILWHIMSYYCISWHISRLHNGITVQPEEGAALVFFQVLPITFYIRDSKRQDGLGALFWTNF